MRCAARLEGGERHHTWLMALAALILSVLALFMAGASALYTKRQADATTATAALEAERRHEERTPLFDVWIEPVNHGQWHRLWVRLTSGEALSSVEVDITEGEGVEFTTGQHGVEPGARPPVLHASKRGDAGQEGMAPDERAAWRVMLPQNRPAKIRLKISAVQNESKWNVAVAVTVPPDPMNMLW